MPVYSLGDYTKQVAQVLENSWVASWAPIDQLQAFAKAVAEGDAPSEITKTTVPAAHQDDVLQSVLSAVDGLKQADEQYTTPTIEDVPGEWASPGESATANGPTLLYAHGGGFIYGSPGTARRATRRLASLTGGRCLAFQYRTSPTNSFPAPLVDAFVAYLSLLAPPKDSGWDAVDPKRLIFAGESSGLNLQFGLLQVIMYLRKHKPTVRFHGQDVKLELPAAVAGMCGFMDITCGLPSWSKNSKWDVLPELQPSYVQEWKDQELWPTDPPRADIYCERSAMTHQLVSPVTTPSWAGAPPVFIACGEERNTDGNLYFVKQAASQGVTVKFLQYEYMTHVWPTALPKIPHAAHVLRQWADFMVNVAKGEPVETSAHFVSFDDLRSKPMDIPSITPLDRAEVLRLTAKARDSRLMLRRKDPKANL